MNPEHWTSTLTCVLMIVKRVNSCFLQDQWNCTSTRRWSFSVLEKCYWAMKYKTRNLLRFKSINKAYLKLSKFRIVRFVCVSLRIVTPFINQITLLWGPFPSQAIIVINFLKCWKKLSTCYSAGTKSLRNSGGNKQTQRALLYALCQLNARDLYQFDNLPACLFVNRLCWITINVISQPC